MNHASREHQLREVTSRWQPSLLRLCAGYEHSVGEQERLLREIMTAIWRSLPRAPDDESLEPWVFRIAHNVATRHMALHSRKKRKAAPPTPEDTARESERQHRRLDTLRATMKRLKPLDRQVALLFLEGIPGEEAAEITGLGKNNIISRLHRAGSRLVHAEERLARKEKLEEPKEPKEPGATEQSIDLEVLEDLWKHQELVPVKITEKTLKRRVAHSVRKVIYRDIREWALALLLAPFFVWQAFLMEMPIMRLASLELAGTCIYISYRLYRNGAARMPGDETVATSAYLEAHRAALLGQAKFLLRSRIWHLLPFAIGGVLLIAGIMLELASIGAPAKVLWIVAIVGTTAMLFLWFVDWLHLRGVRKLRERAARLVDDEEFARG